MAVSETPGLTVTAKVTMEPCPTCASTSVGMIQLDSNHWLGVCHDCGEESSIHWSRPRARHLWNIDAKARRVRRETFTPCRGGVPEGRADP